MKYFDASMKKATVLHVCLMLGLSVYWGSSNNEYTLLNYAWGVIVEILWSLAIVGTLCLVYEYQRNSGILSVVGMFWRTLIAKYLAIILAVLVLLVFRIRLDVPSIKFALLFYVLVVSISLAVTWLLFSVDRKKQLIWLIRFCRGS